LRTHCAAELTKHSRAITELKASIKDRATLLTKVTVSQVEIKKSTAKVERDLAMNAQRAQDAADMPTILDYISLVRSNRLLQREVAQSLRKAEVKAGAFGGGSGSSSSGHRRSASAGGGPSAHLHSMSREAESREGADSLRPAAGSGSPAFLASSALGATSQGGGGGFGSSCALPGILGTRPLGTVASVQRVLYSGVGTGAAAPATSTLRSVMPAKTALEASEAMSGRALGGGGLVAPLMRSVSGGAPLPRSVGGFPGALTSSLGKIGGDKQSGPPVLSKLRLGIAGLKGPPPRGAGPTAPQSPSLG
jgi:hypothetical protein